MKAKKYSFGKEVSKRNEHLIKEDDGRYARQMSYKAPLSVGINLAQAKKRLSKPAREPQRDPLGLGDRGYWQRAERSFRKYAGILAT